MDTRLATEDKSLDMLEQTVFIKLGIGKVFGTVCFLGQLEVRNKSIKAEAVIVLEAGFPETFKISCIFPFCFKQKPGIKFPTFYICSFFKNQDSRYEQAKVASPFAKKETATT